ncbi:hypothetical protein B0H17DRAFT_1071896, partial [Mycena rosella]
MQRNPASPQASQANDFALTPYGGNNPPSNGANTPPPLKSTQNKADDKARKQAAKDLTQSWMDRLQLISVIVTTPAGGDTSSSAASQVINAAFLGALVLHVWAAIISFLGAFFLVRYNLKEAKEEQKQAGPDNGSGSGSGKENGSGSGYDGAQHPLARSAVWTTNPHLEQVGPFQRKPPTHLLGRVHNLCILLTFVGFALALLGILAFAWAGNPISVGVVTSVRLR